MKEAIVTIGFFDGVHIGHRRLLDILVEQAKKYKYESIVLTFDRPPHIVTGLLTTLDEKLDILGSMDIDRIEIIEFNRKFCSMLPEEFFKNFLINHFPVKKFIAGYDFRFGKNRVGDISLLRNLCIDNGIDLLEVGPVKYHDTRINRDVIVSASHIRKLITRGEIELVNFLIGRPYTISGKVVKGTGTASKLGFPTINISVTKDKLLSAGIYYVHSVVGKKIYPGVAYIGHKPTLTKLTSRNLLCEVHNIGFNGNLTTHEISILLHKKIRDEKKMRNVELLKKQIASDVELVKKIVEKGDS